MGSFPGFFGLFPIFFVLIFYVVIATIIFIIVRGLKQWSRNNNSPRLTVEAFVATKREQVDNSMHNMGPEAGMTYSTTTTYYATFQVQSGDRMEFMVSGQEYGLLAEGDRGMLSFQGTRYLGFERTGENTKYIDQ